jgi:predicted RNase H-like HicB family nuclease
MEGSSERVFNVVVERDPESGWLVGEVVELPGCYTQAPDLDVLNANLQEAIRAYLKGTDSTEPFPIYVGTHQVKVPA